MKVNALILAGGKSSRMGQDKALLLINGTPLLQQIDRIAGKCCNSIYILTPWPEKYRNIIANKSNFLVESGTENGSLFAFYQGLQQLETTANWLLLLACDLPLLDAKILLNWRKKLEHLSPKILAYVPKNGDHWEPLCGFYRPEILPDLGNFIQGGDRAFQKFFKMIPVREIKLNDREKQMLFNCNRPDDLRKINSTHLDSSFL